MNTPYITDRPLTDHDFFFGRTASLDLLGDYLRRGERFILLWGKKQIGKTSWLNQLASFLGERFAVRIVAWPDLTKGPCQGERPLACLIVGIARALGHSDPSDEQRQRPAEYLHSLFSGPETTTALICFDGLPAEELAAGRGWEEAIEVLRQALANLTALAVILVIEGHRGPEQTWLSESAEIVLGPLDDMAAEDLLTTPARSRLAYDYESIRRIYRLSGGEPLLLQRFGHILYERRQEAGWVGLPEVEDALRAVMEESAAEFEARWQALDPLAQIAIAAFAEMLGSHGMGSAHDVGFYLSRLHVEITVAEIETALQTLAQQDILERLGGDTYRFRVELFRLWLRESHGALQAAQAVRRYRRRSLPRTKRGRSRAFDWGGFFLWAVAGVLAVLVILAWQARDRRVIWTTGPTPMAATTPAPPTELPTPPAGIAPGHIVYMGKMSPEDHWDIYIMRSDGSDPVRLTENDADDTSPVLSPDGRRIAFVSTRDGNREIYVMSSDGSGASNLTLNAAEDWTPSWSPDGQRIAFASFREGNWEIYTMKADGSDLRRLTNHPAADYAPAWSPDGKRIAFVSNRDGNLEIYIMASDGTNPQRFTEHPATDQAPAWSPDGRELLWESYRDGNMEIYAAALDGSNLRSVSRDAYADDHGPTWSPWGDSVAFFSNRDGGWDIYTVNLETGQRANITMSPLWEQYPMWGP
ncbi:MAG: PD40 domain-containing protein [Chloroflexi bacterium]|nr:PD40 domain-containing protein [Chloroflexota bacterium]